MKEEAERERERERERETARFKTRLSSDWPSFFLPPPGRPRLEQGAWWKQKPFLTRTSPHCGVAFRERFLKGLIVPHCCFWGCRFLHFSWHINWCGSFQKLKYGQQPPAQQSPNLTLPITVFIFSFQCHGRWFHWIMFHVVHRVSQWLKLYFSPIHTISTAHTTYRKDTEWFDLLISQRNSIEGEKRNERSNGR